MVKTDCGSLLLRCCQGLLNIRKAEIHADRDALFHALESCKELISAEQVYSAGRARQLGGSGEQAAHESARAVSLFGCVEKSYIQLALEEIDLAERHYKQQLIIQLLLEGLRSRGIVVDNYPFSFAGVETSALEHAYNVCNSEIQPACEASFQLFVAAEMILTLRHHVMVENWGAMKKYLEGLAEDPQFFLRFESHVSHEFECAKKVMKVMYAVTRATDAYQRGAITGTADTLMNNAAAPIDAAPLLKSIKGSKIYTCSFYKQFPY